MSCTLLLSLSTPNLIGSFASYETNSLNSVKESTDGSESKQIMKVNSEKRKRSEHDMTVVVGVGCEEEYITLINRLFVVCVSLYIEVVLRGTTRSSGGSQPVGSSTL